MSQVPSGVTVSLTFRKSYCLLPEYSFNLSQSDFLESDVLKIEVSIKYYSFNHKVN